MNCAIVYLHLPQTNFFKKRPCSTSRIDANISLNPPNTKLIPKPTPSISILKVYDDTTSQNSTTSVQYSRNSNSTSYTKLSPSYKSCERFHKYSTEQICSILNEHDRTSRIST